MTCWLFHRWTKWEQFSIPIMVMSRSSNVPHRADQDMQKRTCERCGFVERRELPL